MKSEIREIENQIPVREENTTLIMKEPETPTPKTPEPDKKQPEVPNQNPGKTNPIPEVPDTEVPSRENPIGPGDPHHEEEPEHTIHTARPDEPQ